MSSKTEREGRLHVTLLVWKGLGPTSGFYRYRLDFINEDACTRAADAMLKHHLRKAADLTRWSRWPQDAATKNADEAQAMREAERGLFLSLSLRPSKSMARWAWMGRGSRRTAWRCARRESRTRPRG